MKRLFHRHPSLLLFVFDAKRPQLRQEPDVLLNESGEMSSGESLLVRIGMDLWNGTGNSRLPDILERLDTGNFENVIAAMQYLGPKATTSKQCRCQPSLQADPNWDQVLF